MVASIYATQQPAFRQWTPARLFGPSDTGVWLEPSLTTTFQDSAGTTPSVVGLGVGRLIDQSPTSHHATQATAGFKPILRQNATTLAYYLEYDGLDDFLATAAIDLTVTDEVTVFIGVRKQSDAARGMVTEFSASTGTNAGAFLISAPDTVAANAALYSRGTVIAGNTGAVATGLTAPVSMVMTGLCNISADTETLRINGVQAASPALDQGTGNFGNYPLYIGRRGGVSLPLNGHIYCLVVVPRICTADEITHTETYINRLCAAY